MKQPMMKQLVTLTVAVVATGLLALSASAQLQVVDSQTGLISLSADGLGSNSGGTVDYDKPAGATVRKIFVSAASNFDRVIADGDITMDAGSGAVGIAWDQCVFNNAGGGLPTFFQNCFADVTSLFEGDLNAAPAGPGTIAVTEFASDTIDGVALFVIWDDPAVTTQTTVVLLFGGQDTTGDQFNITLAEPLDLDTGVADMGLAISFSFQGPTGSTMISELDVNGQRLTSSAGGEDDGEALNGALITVGGIGDTNDNPPDPFAGSSNLRDDDELYSLIPFVNEGDTIITVDTLNPSDDDNIFCAYFVTSVPSIVGAGITLSPVSSECIVGDEHTVTATVVDEGGNPIEGVDVTFTIQSGPHAGLMGMDTTDVNGEATFSYVGTDVGDDEIIACFTNEQNEEICSNIATKSWVECMLFAGVQQASQPFDDPLAGPEDMQYVFQKGNLQWPVLETSIPTIMVPDRPRFEGMTFRMQIWMRNPTVFPNDPFQASNALEWTIGGGAPSVVGNPEFINFTGGPAERGEVLSLSFDVTGL